MNKQNMQAWLRDNLEGFGAYELPMSPIGLVSYCLPHKNGRGSVIYVRKQNDYYYLTGGWEPFEQGKQGLVTLRQSVTVTEPASRGIGEAFVAAYGAKLKERN